MLCLLIDFVHAHVLNYYILAGKFISADVVVSLKLISLLVQDGEWNKDLFE